MTSSQAGATETGTQVSAACQGSEGSTCTHRIYAKSAAHSATGGNEASAKATCKASGGAGGGACATSAIAQTTENSAMAAAYCQGSKGADCSYSYRAHSSASAGSAYGTATGHGEGTFGGGQVMTTASAQSMANGASASASCQGTPGTECSHYYEASASAYDKDPVSGSWAEASAHGSGGGGMGGGGVSVSAWAYAAGNSASAGASCSGAANCDSSYYAYAAHSASGPGSDETGRLGRYDASKWGSCSGGGNGYCSITATADPNDPDGGEVSCDGNCSNVKEGGGRTFTAIGPPPERAEVPLEPIEAVEGLGEDGSGIAAEEDADGNWTIAVKEAGEEAVVSPCPECAPGTEIVSEDGTSTLTFTEDGVEATTESAGDNPDHECAGSEGCGVGTYGDGNGAAWVEGIGYSYDGISDTQVEYDGGVEAGPWAPSDPNYVNNEARFTNLDGAPFATTCFGGCEGDISNADIGNGQWTDHIDIENSAYWLTGRDGIGSAATLSFAGKGTVTTDEGHVISADGNSKVAADSWTSITTMDAYGNPGFYTISGGQSGFVDLGNGYRIDQDAASSNRPPARTDDQRHYCGRPGRRRLDPVRGFLHAEAPRGDGANAGVPRRLHAVRAARRARGERRGRVGAG
jgi:hypothetical protein